MDFCILIQLFLHYSREPEPQILEYQTQQYKLLPHIASVFAIVFAGRSLLAVYHKVSTDIGKGNVNFLPEVGLFFSLAPNGNFYSGAIKKVIEESH